MDHGQKKVWSSNNSSDSFLPISSREGYACANASITKGVTSAPMSIQQCFERFPYIATMADALGVTLTKTIGSEKIYNTWTGPGTGPDFDPNLVSKPIDLNLPKVANECDNIDIQLGNDWLGCLWGSPEASFSCICPYIGDKYEAYLKHRLTVATFWNTPKYAPVQRKEFLDEMAYGRQITINISGDFSVSLGDVVEINVTAASGYPYGSYPSNLNGKYWVVEIKHVVNSGGTHETRLKLAQPAVSSV